MAEKNFIVVPAYVVPAAFFAGADAAEAEAQRMVEKDRVPRVVLQLHTDLRPSLTPRVDITRFAKEVICEVA